MTSRSLRFLSRLVLVIALLAAACDDDVIVPDTVAPNPDHGTIDMSKEVGAVDAAQEGGADLTADAAPPATKKCTPAVGGGGCGPNSKGSCNVDADCASLGQWKYCHPTGVCVLCNKDADCPGGSGGAYCIPSASSSKVGACCVHCKQDSHCTKGAGNTGKCDSAGSHLCIRCDTDTECRDAKLGYSCVKGFCRACATDQDCIDSKQGDTCGSVACYQKCGPTNPCTKGANNTGKCYPPSSPSPVQSMCNGCETDADCKSAFSGPVMVGWSCN